MPVSTGNWLQMYSSCLNSQDRIWMLVFFPLPILLICLRTIRVKLTIIPQLMSNQDNHAVRRQQIVVSKQNSV